MSIPLYRACRCAVVIMMPLLAHCIGGFFPPVGPPDTSGVLRTTPAGLIQQLIESYQTRQLSVFRDIVDENSFRFYISPYILSELRSVDKGRTEYIPPDSIPFVSGNTYTYLTAQDEIAIHRNLFAHADTLQFIQKPVVDTVYYERTFNRFDTLVFMDTLYHDSCLLLPQCPESLFALHDTVVIPDTVVRSVYDTVSATVLVWPSQIKITANEIAQEYGTGTNVFDVGWQVFRARREDDGLWKLVKWFELDY